ncbi:C-type lectin domain family 2 member F-like [Mastomys coucha]|uniref:C-type lectin domain family 2 member F-like n=1 Tax=Mastomys coucha TaxID=35658 RepID=UPI001262947A|nr:C-type lectin domain family 2 member F-like [Mastomys coucha]
MNAQCLQKLEDSNECPGTGAVHCKMLQGKSLRIISSKSHVKLYCCYGVITVLTVAVVALSVALSVRKTEQIPNKNNTCAPCPRNWIGFGNKCFYFSEQTRNWTFAQDFCMAQEAQLARFDNEEEMNFLSRYRETSNYWIGLHRESSKHPWMWADSTEYNNLVSIRGDEKHCYLSDNGISSSRNSTNRKWICSKSSNKPHSQARKSTSRP